MIDNPRDEQMSDDVIMVYADGGLTPDQREVVRDALSRDPELMRRYESFVFTRAMISRPFDAITSGPIPERLLRAIGAPVRGPLRPSAAAGTSLLERLAAALRMPALSMAVALPSLLVAGAIGWVLHDTGPAPLEAGGYSASAALKAVLETTPRGSAADVVAGVTLKPTYSFATTQGGWCRQFEVAYGAALQSAGMACRQRDGGWNIIAQTDPAPPAAAPSPGKYAPAGASDDPLQDLRARIKAGEVLDREQEIDVIRRHWQTRK